MSNAESVTKDVSKDASFPLLGIKLQQALHPVIHPTLSYPFLPDDILLFKHDGSITRPTSPERGYRPYVMPFTPCLCRMVRTTASLMVFVGVQFSILGFWIIDAAFTGYHLENRNDLYDVSLHDFMLYGAVQWEIMALVFVNIWIFAIRFIILAFYLTYYVFLLLSLIRTSSGSECPLRCGTWTCCSAHRLLGPELVRLLFVIEEFWNYLIEFFRLYKPRHRRLRNQEDNPDGVTREKCLRSLEQGWLIVRLTRYPDYFTFSPLWLCRILNRAYLARMACSRWAGAYGLVAFLQQEGRLGPNSRDDAPSYAIFLEESEFFGPENDGTGVGANIEDDNPGDPMDQDKYLFTWMPCPDDTKGRKMVRDITEFCQYN
ncbi:hypothetical protein F5X97DRAFT_340846 [Nemania serpens]|nr:hypothetical protein F5X97DRAFT_340846 [Nemania serpens]